MLNVSEEVVSVEVVADGAGNPLGPGCIVCDARYANIGQESHTPDGGYSSYSSDNGYGGRWKFYKVPQDKIDALLYGIPVTDLSQLSDDKYYYIISQFDGFKNGATPNNPEGKEAALGYSSADGVSGSLANMVSWVVQKRTEPDANVVWKIIKTGDNYKLQNVGSGKYAGAAADESKIGWTDDFEVAQVLTPTTGNAFTIGNAVPASNVTTWKISGGYHVNTADFLQAATGTDPYGGTAGSERAWKIYELSDAQVQVMCNVLAQELQTAVNIGVGVVTGIKDETSMAAAQALLAATPDYDALKNALDNYVMNFTDGYYRIVYPYSASGSSGDNYLRFGNDLKLYADVEFSDLSDYSTVFKAEITSTSESRAAGNGYRMILTSQGLRPTDTGYDKHQAMAEPESQFAIAIRHNESLGEFLIGISDASAIYVNTRYIYKKPAGESKKIYSTGGNAKSARAKIYPATDITVALHQVGDDYWGTLYVPFGVTLPEGTEAYVGTVEDEP